MKSFFFFFESLAFLVRSSLFPHISNWFMIKYLCGRCACAGKQKQMLTNSTFLSR